jgi:histidine triad (HIT) family protein
MKDKSCIFCKIAKGQIEQKKVMESDNFFAILDIKPSATGHTLVIPKKHFVTLLDIPDKLGIEMIKFTKKVASNLMDEKYGDGFNVIMNNTAVAGQMVMHAHVHVIPRKEDDGLRFLTRV